MLSGYLMLGKDESFVNSLKRILYRVAIPLLFWFIFYTWYGGGLPSFKHFHTDTLSKMFYGNMYHLYFLVIIIGLYFVAPVMRSFLRSITPASGKFFMNTLLLAGITMVALQFIFQACGSENFFTKWMPYTGFFVAGFILGNKADTFKRNKLLLVYGLAFAATLGGNYFQYLLTTHNFNLFASKGCISHYTDHYLSVNVVLMSLSAFLLLLKPKYENLKKNILANNLVQSVARASFGIYIIHAFVARFLEMQFHLAIDFSPLPIPVIIISRLILVLSISYLITILFLKIPVLKLLFGGR